MSHAEGNSGVTERGLTSEGGHGEEPIPMFPAGPFVDAGGTAVLLEQPPSTNSSTTAASSH